MAFVEVRLPENFTDISGGGPQFVTFRTTTRSGAETAVGVWNYPRFTWELNSAAITKAAYDELLAFYIARYGALDGFRFKDPRDYLICRDASAVEAPVSTVQLTTTTFQIVRPYTYGGVTISVPVYKINGNTLTNTVATQANSTVRVYQADGTTEVTSGWTVNLTTGVITFSVAPGYLPKCSCEFDWPVRFDTDQMPTSYAGFVRALSSVRLVEIKQL
jgi:uncharacterized protein (TIGR02217 family)